MFVYYNVVLKFVKRKGISVWKKYIIVIIEWNENVGFSLISFVLVRLSQKCVFKERNLLDKFFRIRMLYIKAF